MFRLKIDEELLGKCLEGVSLDKGDKLTVKYSALDGKAEDVEVLTIKTIEHCNGDVFSLTFEEKIGEYTFNLNQLIHFKTNS